MATECPPNPPANRCESMPTSVTLRILRSGPNKPHYQNFTITISEQMRLIDALHRIKLEQDSSLGYTYSCDGRRRCGTCGVMVNDKPRLACFTPLERNVTIEPLLGFPAIQDLIIDRTTYEKRIQAIQPAVMSSEDVDGLEQGDRESQALSHCIECLCCQAACPVAIEETWKRFAGPAIFVQLGKVSFNPRDRADRTQIAMDQGIHNCDKCYECEKTCPVGIEIVHAIERLQQSARKKALMPGTRSPRAFVELLEGRIA